MSEVLIKHREQERAALVEKQGAKVPLPPLTVWTSTRLRTVQTSDYLRDKGYKVRQRSQMSQINPGVCEKMAERAIRTIYPEEVEKHELDPYHHRYPRAESYHDLAVRLEPIILELEREQNDLLIIAHESVLRVLYAYLMHCSTMDIPFLKFPRDEIIEIIPAAYQNEAKRIHIPGIDPKITPGSPEDIRIPVPGSIPGSGTASGALSPMPGLSSPAEPVERPIEKVVNLTKETVADKVHDED
ncbi:putative 6-phosphofructo-2-kinase/fructose-2 like protein [Verticillium longisporum]|nr:putative 6-phosphofructo-2-kinase/fructose-2 like protein [Verticillium longisporum]